MPVWGTMASSREKPPQQAGDALSPVRAGGQLSHIWRLVSWLWWLEMRAADQADDAGDHRQHPNPNLHDWQLTHRMTYLVLRPFGPEELHRVGARYFDCLPQVAGRRIEFKACPTKAEMNVAPFCGVSLPDPARLVVVPSPGNQAMRPEGHWTQLVAGWEKPDEPAKHANHAKAKPLQALSSPAVPEHLFSRLFCVLARYITVACGSLRLFAAWLFISKFHFMLPSGFVRGL